MGITTTRRSEIEWLYHGVSRIFPHEWRTFVGHVPEAEPPTGVAEGSIQPVLAAYASRMGDRDPSVRDAAAAQWVAWEDAVISLELNGRPGAYSARVGRARNALVRICATSFANGAWLDEGVLLRDARKLEGIPARLIHGRFDLGSPLHVAYELHDSWPGSELIVIEDSGHTGSEAMAARLRLEIDSFAVR